MGAETKALSSHSTNGVLKEFYLDPRILSPIEEASIKIKIFDNLMNLKVQIEMCSQSIFYLNLLAYFNTMFGAIYKIPHSSSSLHD
jgi:hypothetical protein